MFFFLYFTDLESRVFRSSAGSGSGVSLWCPTGAFCPAKVSPERTGRTCRSSPLPANLWPGTKKKKKIHVQLHMLYHFGVMAGSGGDCKGTNKKKQQRSKTSSKKKQKKKTIEPTQNSRDGVQFVFTYVVWVTESQKTDNDDRLII